MATRRRAQRRKSVPARKGSKSVAPKKRAAPRPAAAADAKKTRTKTKKPRTARAPEAEVGLRQKPPGRPEQMRAFFLDARHATDELAEELGESFVLSATSGEDPEEHYQSERPEEEGGPFLETSGHTEFAHGVDESNPEDAEPAPWPQASPGQPPPHRPGGPR